MRSWSMSVRMTGTLSWRTKSSASWLAMRPAPTMPTPLTLRASERSGCSGGTLGALVHQIEGVQTRAEFVRQEEVGKSLVLGREALVRARRHR